MAIVITNGKLYMYLNEYGKHRKTDDITKAIQYKSKCEAVSYMYKAPSKTKGFYVYDTTDNIVLWERKIKTARLSAKNILSQHVS